MEPTRDWPDPPALLRVQVLDHGYVQLADRMGNDLSIVRAARVSYAAGWRTGEDEGKDAKLIHYLLRNKHTSPFEHVSLTFEVKAPIFVFRQWHRHRTWSYNEVSARYTELPEEFYVPEEEVITLQSESNKQMRTTEAHPSAKSIRATIYAVNSTAFRIYRQMMETGCPRELARSILPVGTYSTMFATVNLLNLMRFLSLRTHEHAQHEIRVYADAMQRIASTCVPVAMQAFQEYGL